MAQQGSIRRAMPNQDARQEWAERRRAMERSRQSYSPDGISPQRPALSDIAVPILRFGLGITGLRKRAERNALAVGLNTIRLSLPDLPPAFHGYRILQLSDLHLDIHPDLAARLAQVVEGVEADLVLYTGDYSTRHQRQPLGGLRELAPLARALRGRDGSIAILGNHDDAGTAEHLEAMGLTLLINEHVSIARGGDVLHLTGLDDVHHFYSEHALQALQEAPEGFRVAVVHSPEAADLAAAEGYRLYLCGHTHGGQICLPGGRPLLSAMTRCHDLVSGHWTFGAMQGFTSRGVGSSGLPARFNCPPEACLIELSRADAD